MFSYEFKIRKLGKSSKLKAFVTIVVDGIMELHGFKIIEGSNGLFVTPPSHKGVAMIDGVETEKYYDDITFSGEEGADIFREIKQQILSEYSSGSSNFSRGDAAKAHAAKAIKSKEPDVEVEVVEPKKSAAPAKSKETAPERTRKPLWGF